MPNITAPALPALRAADVRHQASSFLVASLDWFRSYWLEILIAVAIGTVIAAILFAARTLGSRLGRGGTGNAGGTGWSSIIGRAIGRTNSFFIVMLAARLVAGYATPPAEIAQTIRFLFTIASVFQAAIWARELILGGIEHRTAAAIERGEGMGTALGLIRLFVTFSVFAIALVLVLDNVGVNVTGLVAGLGIGGIAIGLAAQSVFADLFAALAIIFDRPFRNGDNVSYGDTSGLIERIGLKSTRIRAFTGEERIIANRLLLDREVANHTLRDHRRAKFAIGVTYDTPPAVCARLPALCREIVEAQGRKFVRCGFVGFGGSSLDFELEFDSEGADFAAFYDGRTAVGIAILDRFNQQGIAFAFPTQTIIPAAGAALPQLDAPSGGA